MKPPRITSTFAIIDIERGRTSLVKYLRANPGLEVNIRAVITDPYGRDDGDSMEFNAEVLSIEAA